MARLEGKVAAVTGGAGGIGGATVARLVEEGARVAFCDWDAERGEKLAAELGDAVRFVAADVQHEDQAAGLVRTAVEQFGRLDVLVNNAGVRNYQDVTEASAESWQRILGVNLMGYAFCAKAAIPAMRANGGGVIVNIASVRSLVAGSRTVQYDTTKAAILGLTRSMARDHAADGIRVVAVGPGPIFTHFHAQRARELGQTEDQYRAAFGADTMMNRPGTPREVADAVLFLASDEASFITGTCLFVDGGQTGL
ncbi:MAG: SDR family oxidoreductase [Ectothiorhodospiraceae bacterium]|nr:SDR family oxidoreductase [Chromatiales bacterium]MCP5154159.1 SDR family oxidoreductase [Ectothiorhodospiraceae bacterium]